MLEIVVCGMPQPAESCVWRRTWGAMADVSRQVTLIVRLRLIITARYFSTRYFKLKRLYSAEVCASKSSRRESL